MPNKNKHKTKLQKQVYIKHGMYIHGNKYIAISIQKFKVPTHLN